MAARFQYQGKAEPLVTEPPDPTIPTKLARDYDWPLPLTLLAGWRKAAGVAASQYPFPTPTVEPPLMATLKLAYGTVTAMTVTNLNSLASSATVGWQSTVVDNVSPLYLDAHVQVVVDMANTAPANDQALYVYAYGGLDTSYTNPASGSEGTITLTSISSTGQNFKLIGIMPYTTADEIIESQPFSVAAAFGGILPRKWGIVIVNFTGAAIAASGNSVSWVGIQVQSV